MNDGESGECSLAGDLERFLEGDPDDSRLELEWDIASNAAVVKRSSAVDVKRCV